MTEPPWRDAVYALPGAIHPRGRIEDIRSALVAVWQTVNGAPPGLIAEYRNLSEAVVRRTADNHDVVNLGLGLKPGLDDGQLLSILAGAIRALEDALVAGSTEASAANPEKDWRVKVQGRDFYLIPFPRRRKEPAPEKDFRPFSQRGVKSFRILPSTIDRYPIRLVCPYVAGDRDELTFGAALLEDVKFESDESEDSFVVTKVITNDLPGQIARHTTDAHSQHCAALVFPELTIDGSTRLQIQKLLQEKPWIDDKPEDPWPSLNFVVAGSWHEQQDGKFVNIATIYDGEGAELFRHAKLFAFRDKQGRERIELGQTITVLAFHRTLYAFGICLDFCQKFVDGPFGKLDVDFVVVPSCGSCTTMDSHIDAAKIIDIRFAARSFVVQQAYPTLGRHGHGFVLPPRTDLKTIKSRGCISKETWQACPAPPHPSKSL